MTGRADYYERIEKKRERLAERAERLRSKAATDFRKADLSEEATGIPFGQPILVGHHSEKRHRRTIDHAWAALGRAVETDKKAGETAARAETYGTHGISSDAPDAVERLREKLEKLEANQKMMREANKLVRKAAKQGVTEEFLTKMALLGIPHNTSRKLLEPDFCGRIGFADYQLSNNNANIKRVKGRIAQLKRSGERETKEVLHNSGVTLVQNTEANRVQLIFPNKPDSDVRKMLKSSGFRWSPREGAWQRMLNNAGVWNANRVLEQLAKKGGEHDQMDAG